MQINGLTCRYDIHKLSKNKCLFLDYLEFNFISEPKNNSRVKRVFCYAVFAIILQIIYLFLEALHNDFLFSSRLHFF